MRGRVVVSLNMSLYARISSYVLVLQIGQAFARKMEATQHAAAAGHPGVNVCFKRGVQGLLMVFKLVMLQSYRNYVSNIWITGMGVRRLRA